MNKVSFIIVNFWRGLLRIRRSKLAFRQSNGYFSKVPSVRPQKTAFTLSQDREADLSPRQNTEWRFYYVSAQRCNFTSSVNKTKDYSHQELSLCAYNTSYSNILYCLTTSLSCTVWATCHLQLKPCEVFTSAGRSQRPWGDGAVSTQRPPTCCSLFLTTFLHSEAARSPKNRGNFQSCLQQQRQEFLKETSETSFSWNMIFSSPKDLQCVQRISGLYSGNRVGYKMGFREANKSC